MNYIIKSALYLILFACYSTIYANVPDGLWFWGEYPEGTILSDWLTAIWVLSFIQSLLLKLVLPVILIGSSLYIAYELFTAEGDESKMKKAWKSVTFAAIGLVSIAVSYAFVSVLSRISL